MLDGSGVKAMPGSIPTHNSGSLENTGNQMGQTKNIFKKIQVFFLCYQFGLKNLVAYNQFARIGILEDMLIQNAKISIAYTLNSK